MALFLLSWDDPVTPKAPLQLQILQLLPQLFPLLLFLLLPAKTEPEDVNSADGPLFRGQHRPLGNGEEAWRRLLTAGGLTCKWLSAHQIRYCSSP